MGLFITACIITGIGIYSNQIIDEMHKGLLDIFSSQQIVNKFENDTNNLMLYDFNFLPSIEISKISRTKEIYDDFMAHNASKVFRFEDIDQENGMNTKAKLIVNLTELNRYIRFQVKVRSRV